MKSVDVIEGIQNYILNWVKVRKGENILIVADSLADPLIIDLAAAVAKAQKANVVVSWIEFNPLQTQGGGKIIEWALKGADKVLRFTFAISHDKGTVEACQEYGVRLYGVTNPTSDFFASEAAQFPVPLILEIAKETVHRARSHTKIHITHENGTDLWAEGRPENWGSATRPRDFGGDYKDWDYDTELPGNYPMTFPGEVVGLIPPDTANGVAVYHAYSRVGVCKTPLKLTFKDCYFINVEGGDEATVLRNVIHGVPHANYLEEIMFGLHPKARNILDQKPLPNEAERRAGNLHLGNGNRRLMSMKPFADNDLGRVFAPKETSKAQLHLDGFILNPTITIGDDVLIDKGRLTVLDSPRIREIAREYGDPDKLLS